MKTNPVTKVLGYHFQPMLLSLGLLQVVASAWAADGWPVWTNHFNGNGVGSNYDEAHAITTDQSGNIYIAGESVGNNGYTDFVMIKYSSLGVPLWTNRYNGTGNAGDIADALTVTGSGDVYVTGRSAGTQGGGDDFATVKYSNTGIPVWTNRYNGPASADDRPFAIAVTENGDAYVTGASTGNGSGYDWVTIKYSSSGTPAWTNRFTSAGGSDDVARSLAVATNGDVFVTGYSYDSVGYSDYATIKYSSAGAAVWTNFFAGSGEWEDVASSVALDGVGNVFVTGEASGFESGTDFATIKYTSAGMPVWTNYYTTDDTGLAEDTAVAVAVDSAGSVLVAGYSYLRGSSYDYLTIKYTSAGVPVWTNRYTSVGKNGDFASALAVDGSGNVFVTGTSIRGGAECYLTVAYSGAGSPLWTNYYNGAANFSDNPRAIAVDKTGNVYVTGRSVNSLENGYDFATVKYAAASPNTPALIPLSFTRAGSNMILSWTNLDFSLQSAVTITGTFINITGATSPYTNGTSGSRQFFRLIGK